MWVVKPITFNGFDFERAGPATAYDSIGKLTEYAADVLRYGYNPETLDYIGPIFESESTNLIAYSNDFTEWDALAVTIGAEAPELNPDGTTTAQYLDAVPEAFSSISYPLGTLAPGNYTFSIFAKKRTAGNGGDSIVRMILQIPGADAQAHFSIEPTDAGIMFSNASVIDSEIEKIEYSDHYRISIKANVSTSANCWAVIVADNTDIFNGDGLHYLWGAQVEPGNKTSFIYTSGTTETRAADIQSEAPPTMVDSNIPEDDADEWSTGDDYVVNDTVMVLGNVHRVYRAAANNGSGDPKYPPENPTIWIDIGATNRWRAFDMDVGSDLQSTGTDLIEYTLSIDEQITNIALFNVIGSTARATMYYGEEVIYDEEIELIAPPTESQWWNYWFDRRAQIKDVAFFNLPPASPTSIRIQITSEGQAALGKVVIGYAFYAGFAEYGSTGIGITSFSTKERDAFGNYFIQSRRFVGNMNVKTVVDPGNEVFLKDALADLRDIPSAYIVETDNYPILIFGFFKDFNVLFSTPAASYCSADIEGI